MSHCPMQKPAASESLLSFKWIIYSFLNLSWSGAKKGSWLGVNYLETSRQGGVGGLVLKSSITLPWWTAYKSQSGNGRGWVGRGWIVEHHEEFAYTSQMKWHSSCRNIKMIQVILKRVWKQQMRSLWSNLWLSVSNKQRDFIARAWRASVLRS